jgi:hypothetical protein
MAHNILKPSKNTFLSIFKYFFIFCNKLEYLHFDIWEFHGNLTKSQLKNM